MLRAGDEGGGALGGGADVDKRGVLWDVADVGGVVGARRGGAVCAHGDVLPGPGEGIVVAQRADERGADSREELERFDGQGGAGDADDRSHHTSLRTGGHLRVGGEEVFVDRAVAGVEDGELRVVAQKRGPYVRNAQFMGGPGG